MRANINCHIYTHGKRTVLNTHIATRPKWHSMAFSLWRKLCVYFFCLHQNWFGRWCFGFHFIWFQFFFSCLFVVCDLCILIFHVCASVCLKLWLETSHSKWLSSLNLEYIARYVSRIIVVDLGASEQHTNNQFDECRQRNCLLMRMSMLNEFHKKNVRNEQIQKPNRWEKSSLSSHWRLLIKDIYL